MAAKNGNLIKNTVIYDSICSMMFDFIPPTGTATVSACAVKNNTWSPDCDLVQNCFTTQGVKYLPMIKATITWTDCELAGMDANCQISYAGQAFYNGETRNICPDAYMLKHTDYTTTNTTLFPAHFGKAGEFWAYDENHDFGPTLAGDGDLLMMRYFYSKTYTTTCFVEYFRATNALMINKRLSNTFSNNIDLYSYDYTTSNCLASPSLGSLSTKSYNYIGEMITPKPTFNNYRLGNSFFVSQWSDPVTTITYTFEKGDYWDCINAPFSFAGGAVAAGGTGTANCAAIYD